MRLKRFTYNFGCACVLSVAFAGAVVASPADELKAANQLYDAGKFSDAIAGYEKIEPKTATLFFNLGNACFREGQIGKAVLNFERARRLSPRDPDILANLKFAQQKLGVDELNAPTKAWQRFLRSAIDSRTPGEWRAFELTGIWLAALAIGLSLWLHRARTALMVVSVAAFAWSAAAAAALSYQAVGERAAPKAIILAKETAARFAPLPDATIHFKLGEGTAVSIYEDRGEWLYVERADGQQGWVKRDALARIAME
jgi:tetratricopeptide (TPR) repeat protein